MKKKLRTKKIVHQKRRLQTKGVIGDGILWGIILIGLVIMSFYFAGSALPQQRTSGDNQAVVTILPHKDNGSNPNIQMQYFEGVTGQPTPTKKPASELPLPEPSK